VYLHPCKLIYWNPDHRTLHPIFLDMIATVPLSTVASYEFVELALRTRRPAQLLSCILKIFSSHSDGADTGHGRSTYKCSEGTLVSYECPLVSLIESLLQVPMILVYRLHVLTLLARDLQRDFDTTLLFPFFHPAACVTPSHECIIGRLLLIYGHLSKSISTPSF
jgi:hypothetical protein